MNLPVPRTLSTLLAGAGRGLAEDWRASGLHGALTARPRADGFRLRPRDFRPVDPELTIRSIVACFGIFSVTMVAITWQSSCPVWYVVCFGSGM